MGEEAWFWKILVSGRYLGLTEETIIGHSGHLILSVILYDFHNIIFNNIRNF